MFKNTKAFSGFSVDDIAQAKKFYAETLDLDVKEGEMDTLELNIAGGSSILIYPKGKDHTPATFTILNFPTENIDATVDKLVEKGVTFEQYTGDLQTDEKGIARGKEKDMGPNIAWFKDPAGNILAVLEM